jgi:hypothetical protein
MAQMGGMGYGGMGYGGGGQPYGQPGQPYGMPQQQGMQTPVADMQMLLQREQAMQQQAIQQAQMGGGDGRQSFEQGTFPSSLASLREGL